MRTLRQWIFRNGTSQQRHILAITSHGASTPQLQPLQPYTSPSQARHLTKFGHRLRSFWSQKMQDTYCEHTCHSCKETEFNGSLFSTHLPISHPHCKPYEIQNASMQPHKFLLLSNVELSHMASVRKEVVITSPSLTQSMSLILVNNTQNINSSESSPSRRRPKLHPHI